MILLNYIGWLGSFIAIFSSLFLSIGLIKKKLTIFINFAIISKLNHKGI